MPFQISLAQWSLHRALFAGEVDTLDFAQTAKRDFGIDAIEYVNGFFKDRAGDFAYLKELKTRAADEGVENLLIMIDGEGALADADSAARRRAVERHFRWIAAAAYLGCHSIRVNVAGGGSAEEQAARGAESLVRLAELGRDYEIDVIVENHGGRSSNGAWLADVMRRADNEHVGTLPDFGNFKMAEDDWYDRYLGVQEMMPFAKAVSAKSHAFDAEGNETGTDFRKMLRIVLDAGYRGFIGVEYEGSAHPEPEGVQLTRDLLIKVRSELASEYPQ
jgi:sugar phosphate isomerase/epimerase